MNVNTGDIKALNTLTKKELSSLEWIEVPDKHMEHLHGLPRKDRRKYLKENGLFKKGKWSFLA